MASFVAVRDPEEDRREAFLDRVIPELAPVPDLTRGRVDAGPVSVAWAAGGHAPISTARGEADASGDLGVVWGDALERDGRRVRARDLLGSGLAGAGAGAPCFDGFHAWLQVIGGEGLAAGADPLGLFPVYWAQPRRDVLVLASTPGDVGHHPAVDADPDPRGLAGLLLTNGLLEGRTLLEGVRRLGPGSVVAWRPGRPAAEVPAYRPAGGRRAGGRTWRGLARRTDRLLEDAVRRHLGGRRAATLLSGGLDSRMLTGYAARAVDLGPAVTLGSAGDLEVRCALPVAEALGLRTLRIEQRRGEIASGARIEARRKVLSDGFSGVHGWSPALRGPDLPPVLLTGLLGNAVLAASHLDWARASPEEGPSAGAFVRALNRWGVPVDVLRRISGGWLREEGVEPVLDGLRERLLPAGPSLEPRLWLSYLRHRQRFHVGSQMWRLSFASWPTAPVADRTVLDAMGSVPVAVLEDRRLQVDLLRTRFPGLARLPQDRNSWNTLPPDPTTAQRVRHAFSRRVRRSRIGRLWRRFRGERRYYYRIYDLDSPAWRTIRRIAEPGREALRPLVDVDLLTRDYLPAPDRSLRLRDGIMDAGGRKLLLGLMLVADRLDSGHGRGAGSRVGVA